MKRLRDLGERWVTKYVSSTLGRLPGSLLPVGDDAADLLLSGRLLVSVDMMVQETDVPEGMAWRDVGYRAVTGSTSDIAAKGGAPRAYLVSLALPAEMTEEEFRELWSGVIEASELYGGVVLGGDTNAGDQVIIDVVCLAEASERPVSRSGARRGDIVAVTGLFGAEAAGLHAMINGVDGELARRAVARMVRPVARVREGRALSRFSSASIDSSDGLAESLYLLAESSGVGFRIDSPPVDPLAEEYSEEFGVDLFDLVFYGGEEYELVVTLSPDDWDEARKNVEDVGGRLIEVGRVTGDVGVVEVLWNGEYVRLSRRGYTHFSGSRRRPSRNLCL